MHWVQKHSPILRYSPAPSKARSFAIRGSHQRVAVGVDFRRGGLVAANGTAEKLSEAMSAVSCAAEIPVMRLRWSSSLTAPRMINQRNAGFVGRGIRETFHKAAISIGAGTVTHTIPTSSHRGRA